MSFHLKIAKNLWRNHLKPESVVVDATVGNGKDLIFLAELLLPCKKARIYGLDIQAKALQNTKKLLQSSLTIPYENNIQLRLQSHEDFPFITSSDLFIYNLGYLPGSDKTLTTKVETTLKSLAKALTILSSKGAISLTLYPGHEEGKKEKEALLSFCQKLCPSLYQVSHHYLMQNVSAPSLLWIQRR